MENTLERYVEALLFASEQPVTIKELTECLQKVFAVDQKGITKLSAVSPEESGDADKEENSKDEQETSISEDLLQELISGLVTKYSAENYSFELRKIGGGFQFLTKAPYHESISILLNLKEKKRLSAAALETLSIIAYKQPITKSEIEQIRGVSADYSIHKLLEKDLIEIAGKRDSAGNPVLYEVSQTFLEYFGINSTLDLPQPKEVEPNTENVVGENSETQS
jgi:segregation and condensation protein B